MNNTLFIFGKKIGFFWQVLVYKPKKKCFGLSFGLKFSIDFRAFAWDKNYSKPKNQKIQKLYKGKKFIFFIIIQMLKKKRNFFMLIKEFRVFLVFWSKPYFTILFLVEFWSNKPKLFKMQKCEFSKIDNISQDYTAARRPRIIPKPRTTRTSHATSLTTPRTIQKPYT